MNSPMMPDEARDARVELHHRPFGELFDLADRALATLASMAPEYERHLEDPHENGGKYRPYRKVRYVTHWEET